MLKAPLVALTAALSIFVTNTHAQGSVQSNTDAESHLPALKIRGTTAIAENDANAERDADKARRAPVITVVIDLNDFSVSEITPERDDDVPNDPPPPESDEDPNPEDDDTPRFYGEPVSGSFNLVMDRSGSMGTADAEAGPIEDSNGGIITNPNRLQRVKAEATKLLQQLSESDRFALQSFGGGQEQMYYSDLVVANSAGIQQGLQFIQDMQADGHTPAYSALKIACTQYGTELDKIFFLCDGAPNSDQGAPGGNGNVANILADFPTWYAQLKANGCQLVCVHVGNSGAAETFMRALAAAGSGIYIKR